MLTTAESLFSQLREEDERDLAGEREIQKQVESGFGCVGNALLLLLIRTSELASNPTLSPAVSNSVGTGTQKETEAFKKAQFDLNDRSFSDVASVLLDAFPIPSSSSVASLCTADAALIAYLWLNGYNLLQVLLTISIVYN